jgi:hypothetical protein
MRKTPKPARLIISPKNLTALRLDVIQRRRALIVNAAAYGMRHGDDLLALSGPVLRPVERAALAEMVATLSAAERWTDATTRRLQAALAPLRRGARPTPATDPDGGAWDDRRGIAWHLDRLREMIAQHELLRHREGMLSMAATDRMVSPRPRSGRRGRAGRNRQVRFWSGGAPAA